MLKNIVFLTMVTLFFSSCVVNKRYDMECLKGSFVLEKLVESSSTFDLPIPALSVKNRGGFKYPGDRGDEAPVLTSNEMIFSEAGSWEVEADTVMLTFPSLSDEGPYLYLLSPSCDTLFPLLGNPYSNSCFIRRTSTLNNTKK